MKIKLQKKSYAEVLALPKEPPIVPRKPSRFLRGLINVISAFELGALRFKCTKVNMDALDKRKPTLYLMNHSCFTDMKIFERVIPQRFNIIATSDSFVGQRDLLTSLGCVPTTKFVTDATLVRNMMYCFNKLKTSVLMFPEASYSFDGTATTLPHGLGKAVKLFGVQVVMITTYGVFLHDPLYNGLQQRKTRASATMEYILSPEQIKEMSADEIFDKINGYFQFDNFRWQKDNGVKVDEPFRADHLDRVLYKCPHCNTEGQMEGKGTTLTCHHCNKQWILDEYGYMRALQGETEFDHVPTWYAWQRNCVAKEIDNGTYKLDVDVNVVVLKGTKAVYDIGAGHLTHDASGFTLTFDNGNATYTQPASASYSLYADYLWYEIGDVICIGNNDMLYYCFPQDKSVPVAKTRLATEEIFKAIVKK